MTSFTPVYGLEYPNALDAPCDFPADWCEFTADVAAVLSRFELGAQRVLPAIPIAKVMITEQVTIDESAAFPWDTVAVDTAGWTNFDANNQIITISRNAWYSVVIAAVIAPEGSVNQSWFIEANGISGINDVEALDRNTQDIGITSESEVQLISAGTEVSVSGFGVGPSTGADTMTIRSASLTIFWHADEERP